MGITLSLFPFPMIWQAITYVACTCTNSQLTSEFLPQSTLHFLVAPFTRTHLNVHRMHSCHDLIWQGQ